MKHYIIAALLLLLLTACTGTNSGRATFVLTDAAADMGSVTKVKVTIDSVQAHHATGWVSASTTPQTYDLLALKASGNSVLIADTQLRAGTYDQVRLHITKVIITDENGDHVAKLPSDDLKLVGKLQIVANQTSTITFDFIADESLHMTGNGLYIFAPVIKLETRTNAEVDTTYQADVKVSGGTSQSIKQSMDLDGNIGEGLKIGKDAKLSLNGNKITEELRVSIT